MTEIKKFTAIRQRDEIYPAEYLIGRSGFTHRQAVCVKAQQERIMKSDRSTVKINIEIIPIPDRKEEYYVHNTSTYVKELPNNISSTKTNLPHWVKKDSDGNLKFLDSSPFLGPLINLNSNTTDGESELE